MPRILSIVNAPTGPRVYVAGLRFHHGLAGQLLVAAGIALMLHDRHDYPWPTRDAVLPLPHARTLLTDISDPHWLGELTDPLGRDIASIDEWGHAG